MYSVYILSLYKGFALIEPCTADLELDTPTPEIGFSVR